MGNEDLNNKLNLEKIVNDSKIDLYFSKNKEDILLSIGSIVSLNINNQLIDYLIIAKRAVDIANMQAWDYYSVPYGDGLKRDTNGVDNGVYFNHYEIDKITFKQNLLIK